MATNLWIKSCAALALAAITLLAWIPTAFSQATPGADNIKAYRELLFGVNYEDAIKYLDEQKVKYTKLEGVNSGGLRFQFYITLGLMKGVAIENDSININLIFAKCSKEEFLLFAKTVAFSDKITSKSTIEKQNKEFACEPNITNEKEIAVRGFDADKFKALAQKEPKSNFPVFIQVTIRSTLYCGEATVKKYTWRKNDIVSEFITVPENNDFKFLPINDNESNYFSKNFKCEPKDFAAQVNKLRSCFIPSSDRFLIVKDVSVFKKFLECQTQMQKEAAERKAAAAATAEEKKKKEASDY